MADLHPRFVPRLVSAAIFALLLSLSWARSSEAAGLRPLVIVFPSGSGAGGSGIEVQKDGDDVSRIERTTLAARAVRDLLNDSGAVAATVYTPEGSMYKRAIIEANIQVIHPDDLTETERTAVGKSAGAVYVVAVTAQSTKNGIGFEIALQGVDIETRKSYFDSAKAVAGGLAAPGTNDSNAVRRNEVSGGGGSSFDNALQSAANTLVTRLLAGPLADFSRPAVPPSLLPPSSSAVAMPSVPARDTTRVSPPQSLKPAEASAGNSSAPMPTVPLAPTDDQAAASAAADAVLASRREADQLLTSGDNNAAIVLLRRSINQAPEALSLRIALTKAYLAAKRPNDAANEAQRALALDGKSDRPSELELTRLLADAFALNGDTTAAKATYEQVIQAQPSANWARVSLANLLLDENQNDKAEALLREVLRFDTGNREAAVGLARLLADRGDYAGAQHELSRLAAAPGANSSAVYSATIEFFDQRILHLGETIASNRESYGKKVLSREAFYSATSAQTARVAGLVGLLKASPPPPGLPENLQRAYKGRIYAASVLSESVSALTSFLDSGDPDADSKASVQMVEFQREMEEARKADGSQR